MRGFDNVRRNRILGSEVISKVRKLKNGKSVGIGGISSEVIRI